MTAHSPLSPCPYCGEPLPESAATCDKCGNGLPPLPHLESGFPLVKKRYTFRIAVMLSVNIIVVFSIAGVLIYNPLHTTHVGQNSLWQPLLASWVLSGCIAALLIERSQRLTKQNEHKPD